MTGDIENTDVLSYKKEFIGNWWLPDEPDFKIPGKLTFTYKDGHKLHLFGNFNEEKITIPNGVILLGETIFGEKITLLQSFIYDFSIPFGDENKGFSKFSSNRGFIRAHFTSKEEAVFNRINFYLTNFEDWLNLEIFHHSTKDNSLSLEYTFPDVFTYNLATDIKISFIYEVQRSNASRFSINPSFLHRSKISIELPEPIYIDQFGDYIIHFRNLITLALMNPTYEYGLIGYKGKGENDENKINILCKQSQIENPENIPPFSMLFSFNQISDSFQNLLSNWYENLNDLKPVFDLFFKHYYSSERNYFDQFLNYVQALETFHTRKFDQTVDSAEIHKNRCKIIIETCPQEYKDWLRQIISWSNRKTLQQKLEELISQYPDPVINMHGNIENFIKEVKQTRNFLTHYDPSIEDKAIKGGQLKGLTISLGFLLEALLCLEMGMDKEFIREIQNNRKRLPYFYY